MSAPDMNRSPLVGERQRIAARVRSFNSRVNERSGRDLFKAIAVGIGLIVIMTVSLVFDKRWFVLVGTAFVLALVLGLSTAMRGVGLYVPRIPSALVPIAVVPLSYFYGPSWQWAGLLLGLLLVSAWRLAANWFDASLRTRRGIGLDISSSAFVQLYLTFLGSFTVLLAAQPRGELWVLTFGAVVVCVDTGAYVFGMRFGRTPLAPRISPSKTWEGIIGGGITAMVVAVIACTFILDLPWWFGLIMGPMLTITAVAGDLTESMVKRDLGIKDISHWLPGHGGFFDRFDSMLPSGAMAFALYFWSAPLMRVVA